MGPWCQNYREKTILLIRFSEGRLSPVGKSIWDWWLLRYGIATLGNGLLPMIERNHEVEANNRTR
jgi:hypothetical protein